MANQGNVRKSDRYYGHQLGSKERARIADEGDDRSSKAADAYFHPKDPEAITDTADAHEDRQRRRSNMNKVGADYAETPGRITSGSKPYQYAKGGNVKKPGKKAVMAAVMAAHQAGIQKGAAMASPRPPAPTVPPPGAGAPPPGIAGLRPGMKAGGMVQKSHGGQLRKAATALKNFASQEDAEERKEKKEKYARGGRVGGRGDGCAMRGRTRGRMC